MTTFHLQKNSMYDKLNLSDCGTHEKACVDLDIGLYARNGKSTIQQTVDAMKKIAESRGYGKPVLAVGDFVEVFEFPTYARLSEVTLDHGCSLGDFRFEVEVADVIYTGAANARVRTATKRAGVQAVIDTKRGGVLTYGTAPAALPVIGAAAGFDAFHFADTVRNNGRAVIRLKITAVPAAPAAGAPPSANFFDLNCVSLHARFDRYATCYCCDQCQGNDSDIPVSSIA